MVQRRQIERDAVQEASYLCGVHASSAETDDGELPVADLARVQPFRMPAPYSDVAHAETLGGRLFLESDKALRYVRAYDRLREAALSANESAKLIAALAEELS